MKFISLYFLTSILATASFATDFLEIKADYVSYTPKKIQLNTNVSISNQLGNIFSSEAFLSSASTLPEDIFDTLVFNDKVHIFFNDKGTLKCDHAKYYPLQKKAFFYQNPFNLSKVLFKDLGLLSQENIPTPLSIQSKNMEIHLMPSQEDEKSQTIQDIMAENEVCIYYNDEYILMSDTMHYHKSFSSFGGTIHCQKKNTQGFCQIMKTNGDVIEADSFTLYLENKFFSIQEPQGKMVLNTLRPQQSNLQFTAQSLDWLPLEKRLVLYNNVELNEPQYGYITASDQVSIYEEGTPSQWSKVYARGNISLFHQQKNERQEIRCYEELFLNHLDNTTSLKSPANPSKKTQVHYTDSLGDMYANTVKIYYEYQSNKMVPKKIVLEGQVKLYNHTKENSKHPIRQYALANRVLLYPEQQKVYLYAEDNQRVYYLDDINHTKLSAPFITLERSENNNPRIKAKGHVTDFSQEQEKHIKDIFE